MDVEVNRQATPYLGGHIVSGSSTPTPTCISLQFLFLLLLLFVLFLPPPGLEASTLVCFNLTLFQNKFWRNPLWRFSNSNKLQKVILNVQSFAVFLVTLQNKYLQHTNCTEMGCKTFEYFNYVWYNNKVLLIFAANIRKIGCHCCYICNSKTFSN